MNQTVSLGRLAGIEVGANWSPFAVVAVVAVLIGESALPAIAPGSNRSVYWVVAGPAALAFLASLLAHEFAHAVVARRRGITVRSVTSWTLGGVTQLEGEPIRARADAAIAIAGPLTSILAGGVFLGLGTGLQLVGVSAGISIMAAACSWIGAMSWLLAAFDLLPGARLDGGHILRAAVGARRGDRAAAERVAALAGKIIGVALIAIGIVDSVAVRRIDGLWRALVGYVGRAAGMELVASRDRVAMTGVRAQDVMPPHPVVAPVRVAIGAFVASRSGDAPRTAYPVRAARMFTGIVRRTAARGVLRR